MRKKKSGAPIQIYQLDQLTNKEFSAVEKLGAPLHLIITAKDAFYIGTRKGKLIVIGSNARGTAYAIMKLSELAGVSPRRHGTTCSRRSARAYIHP